VKLGLVLPARVSNPSREMNRYWVPIMDALERAGVDVWLSQPRIRLVWLPGRARRGPPLAGITAPFFLRELLRERPDALLTIEFGTHSLWTALAGRVLRAPVLIFHEHSERDGAGQGIARVAYRKLLVRLAHSAVANTRGARHDLERCLGIPGERIVDLPVLVPPEREDLCRIQRDTPSATARPVFLFVGQLIARKNVATLIAAADLLHREGLSFTIWIAGDGEQRADLEDLVFRRDLHERVSFLGPHSYGSVGFLLSACDVFIMPALYDYRSVAVLEAMRFGKPVIDSAGDGNAGDLVRDGVNGVVVDPRDAESIARAMRVFIADPGQIESMGHAAAAALEELTPDRAAAGLRGVLEQLLEESRRSNPRAGLLRSADFTDGRG
jgi:glycosyltransferase involved in cell wall biosynthesis